MIALDASGSTGYVANNGSGTVSVLALSGSDLTPGSLAATIPVGSQPWGVAATGSAVFVANNGSGTVSVIDPSSRSVVATVATGTGPFAIARAFDSVYVTNTGSSTVSTIALAADRVNVTWSKVRRTRTVIGVTPRSPAVEYSIVARKSGKVRRGTCTVPSSGSSVRCRVKVGSGLWRVSVQTRLPWQPVAMGAQNKRFSF
jgi:YVTN family beta-propeller protein